MEAHRGIADVIIAVGDEVLDECIVRFRVHPEKAILIPNGRDTFRVPSPIGSDGESALATLIFVGALTPQKQPERFIEVVGRLRAGARPFPGP